MSERQQIVTFNVRVRLPEARSDEMTELVDRYRESMDDGVYRLSPDEISDEDVAQYVAWQFIAGGDYSDCCELVNA